ncbi:DUF3515 family protein [Leucobacter sp. UCMA 4100]|uniref:DUF3515 family protein n=1 Tax=Leucobacter sp. UCMA 4100 TaxID=2810534 RepID=UPI0022EAD25D|nr:DUF3515 family protein [Leucobacter sp. UCMA 4100]
MRHRSFTPLLASAGAATLFVGLLTGCSVREVPMHPAENANDPACADVIVRLPDEIGELKRRNTNAQSTGAWGDPAGVLLYCGIEPSGPTTDQCVSVNGIDWIMDDSEAPLFRFEAYGREPGLEIVIDSNLSSGSVIAEFGASVSQLPQVRKCTNVSDSLDFSGTSDENPTEPTDDAPAEDAPTESE